MPRKIIIDTDPGQDDAVALLFAFASPELEILGITTVAGNVSLEHTTRNALQVCELGGKEDIPVFAGAEKPLERALVTAEHVHGKTGMEGAVLPEPQINKQDRHAVDWLIQTLRAEDSVTLCVLGPMTNIALALQQAPDIAECIQEIVFMGGARSMGGNITPTAEFNIYADPHAADVVISAGIPLVMHPLDVTHRANMTEAWLQQVLALGGKVGPFAEGILRHNYNFSMGVFQSDIAPLHDPCVIAYLLEPSLFTGKDCYVQVETSSELTMGMTVIDFWQVWEKAPNCHVIYDVDAEGYFKLILTRLARI